MNEINQMSSEDNVEESLVIDGEVWAGELVPEIGSALLPADQNRQELITADEATNIDKWVLTIEAAWGKTVQAVINLGSLLNQAKEELGMSYKELEKRLSLILVE